MLETITNFIIENLFVLLLIKSTLFAAILSQEIADVIMFPFKVVGLVFSWFFGLFKKPTQALKRAKSFEQD